jgi:hypothetical protein
LKKIDTQLDEKVTKAKKAREVGAMASLRSEVHLECHHSSGKAFIKAMQKWYEFFYWKSTKDNRNIGPQTEAILLVSYDIPCFFSQTELEVFLGYVSPNHNVDEALIKMVEEKMLVKATNKVGTQIYYLGHFAMQALKRTKLPDKDARQNKFLESIAICSDNRHRNRRNKRQSTARTSSSNKRQESSASKKSSVTPSTKKKARTGPKLTLFTSAEESSKNPTEPSSKNKDGTQINVKSTTSDDESESSDGSSSNGNSSSGPSSDKESEKSEYSLPNSATKTTSLC